MSLWSKGVNRSKTDVSRLEDLPDVTKLLNESGTFNVNMFVSLYWDKLTQSKSHKLDISKYQLVWWGKFENMHLLQTELAIFDPENKVYFFVTSRSSEFKISHYDKNIISDRSGTTATFNKSIEYKGRTGGKHVLNISESQFKNMKLVLKKLTSFIQPGKKYKELFYDWIDK